MLIEKIFITQRSLKRKNQIRDLIFAITNNEYIEPITLVQLYDGTVRVENGHHRLMAYYACGRAYLENYEYELLYLDTYRPTFGTIKNLVDSVVPL